jgi:hypothetical protein
MLVAMTDNPTADAPGPAGNDSFLPVLTVLDGADEEIVSIGEQYWDLAGFDEFGRPQWAVAARRIGTAGWGQVHVVEAAGIRAVVPGRTCPGCSGPLSLSSRTALERLCQGDDLVTCVDCDENLQLQIARVMDPVRQQRQRVNQTKVVQRQREQELAASWRNRELEVLRETYAVTFQPEDPIPPAGVREESIALALLRYAPSPAPLGPVQDWQDPLHPREGHSGKCVAAALLAGLLSIHPDSSPRAFVWSPPTLQAGLDELGDEDPDLLGPELTNSYYAARAVHYVPYGSSLDTAVRKLDEHLVSRLEPTAMTKARQEELLELLIEVVAEEALRYFVHDLAEHNLPPVPENHLARLRDAGYKAARVRPLGELYNLVWQAVRAAAAAAQAHPRAPKENMTTHAVNRFESVVQRAITDQGWQLKTFSGVSGLELAALTRVVFYGILDKSPFSTSHSDVALSLPDPAPVVDESIPTSPDEQPLAEIDEDWSDLPTLVCGVCRFPVQPQEAWLWVDVGAAAA